MAKSYRGKDIDIGAMREKNAKAIVAGAIGEKRFNVRGDLVGRGGKILKTREQLENEYVSQLPNGAKSRQEHGFNKGLNDFIQRVQVDEKVETLKKTEKEDPNLSTKKDNKVRLSTITKKKEKEAEAKAEAETKLDDIPLDEEDFD